MGNEQKKSAIEVVSGDPVAMGVAQELSYTRLGPSYEHPPYDSRWKNPEVLQATVSVLRRINQMGYDIVPRPKEVLQPLDETES